MPKEIEIAFSKVWRLPSVKKLNISQVGGFVILAREALYEGLDPFDCSRVTLQERCKCNPQQWPRAWAGIRPALEEALPVLRGVYEHKAKERVRKAQGAAVCFAESNQRRRLAGLAKRNAERGVYEYLTDQDTAPVILAPTKAPHFRSNVIDHQARAVIVQNVATSPKQKDGLLRDK